MSHSCTFCNCFHSLRPAGCGRGERGRSWWAPPERPRRVSASRERREGESVACVQQIRRVRRSREPRFMYRPMLTRSAHYFTHFRAPIWQTQRTNQRTPASPSGDAVTSWWGLASPPPDPRRQRAGVPPQYQQVGHPLVLGCRGGYADQLHAGAERRRQSQRSRERPRESRIRRERIEELDRENAKPIKAEAPEEEQTRGTVSAFPMAHRSPEGAGRPLRPPLAGGFFDDPARPEG